MDSDIIKSLSKYENVLITDAKGYILFCDVEDLNVLRIINSWPEDIIGKHFTSFYKDFSESNSSIMQALKYGSSVIDYEQTMRTPDGKEIISHSSTFPVKNDEQIFGAIEFSNRFFQKENIQSLDKIQTHKLYRKNNTVYTIDDLISDDSAMKKIKQKIKRIALNASTTLIYGETGTGKEIIAQGIHNASERYVHPFISLNCSAIPETLIESTLFGTVKGSYTGASDSPGLLEQADKGTLFLDEVNSLPMHIQVKLLKAIEEKSIRRVGGTKTIFSDFCLISAMNENPEKLIEENRLRKDLYYRLNVTEISLPPLRKRKEDIPLLLNHFISFYNERMFTKVAEISPEVIKHLMAYDWPGNVRELRNAIETAYNNIESSVMTIYDFPERILRDDDAANNNIPETSGLKDQLEFFEKELIINAIKKHHGVYADAAKELHISRQSFQYKLNKYNI